MASTKVGMMTRVAAEFIPLGYRRRTNKVVLYKELLDRKPNKFIVNNLAVVGAIMLYDHFHLGHDGWGYVHCLLALPSAVMVGLAAGQKLANRITRG